MVAVYGDLCLLPVNTRPSYSIHSTPNWHATEVLNFSSLCISSSRGHFSGFYTAIIHFRLIHATFFFFFFLLYIPSASVLFRFFWLFSCACCGRNYWHGLQSWVFLPMVWLIPYYTLPSTLEWVSWLHESDLSVAPPAQWVRFMNSLFFPALLGPHPHSHPAPRFPDPLFTPSCFPRCPGFPVPRSPSSPPTSEAASVLQGQSPRCFLVLLGRPFWESCSTGTSSVCAPISLSK